MTSNKIAYLTKIHAKLASLGSINVRECGSKCNYMCSCCRDELTKLLKIDDIMLLESDSPSQLLDRLNHMRKNCDYNV